MDGIGKNLKRIRLLKNLSLKEAGNLLNMTATAISKYEKGEILPDSKKLIDFANAYNYIKELAGQKWVIDYEKYTFIDTEKITLANSVLSDLNDDGEVIISGSFTTKLWDFDADTGVWAIDSTKNNGLPYLRKMKYFD